MKEMKLKAEERGLLGLVARAAFANPFGAERERVDRELAGQSGEVSYEAVIAGAIQRVRGFLGDLRTAGRDDPRRYGGADRELLEVGHLFDVFHETIEAFDALIGSQIRTGDGLCPVPFAEPCLKRLESRGFESAAACRWFAIFYQLRRAYYFIHGSLIGGSASMRTLRRELWNNVFTCDPGLYEKSLWNRMEDFATVLLGETGTGKGAAATCIGRSGFIPFDRRKGRFADSFCRSFTAVNLSQFSETLIESELFGHRKGAFTGAVEAHEGVFARCSPHGSIFLDEIGDVSIPIQIKLLRVIQERAFTPVGSHDTRRFQGRVIAASNRPLTALRQEGRFRDDFFYRLSSDVITMPPLRQCLREDAGELRDRVALTLCRILGEGAGEARVRELGSRVTDRIGEDLGDAYDWPGNTRELEQAVRRILLTGHYRGDRMRVGLSPAERLAARIDVGDLTASELLAAYCALLHDRHGTYEAAARITGLDRRTVKKYIDSMADTAWHSG